jgi:hypothetical protein
MGPFEMRTKFRVMKATHMFDSGLNNRVWLLFKHDYYEILHGGGPLAPN